MTAHAGLPRRLSRASPKGEQLRAILEDLIGSLQPGDPVPSERELAERYDVARMTVRAELGRLATEGLVERVQGRGTFVAEARAAQAATLSSFTEDMRARGLVAGSRVLAHDVLPADDLVAARLGLAPRTPVLRARRVRTADGEPMAVEEAFLEAERFAGLEAGDLEERSLFEVLETRFGARLAYADQRVVAVEIVGEDADLLRVGSGRAGLRFHSLVLDPDDAPVAYAWSLFRGDRYEIRLRQVRAARGRAAGGRP
ncbi:GntR family transcriptional regulator [Baekduia soli]|uniref:GntR family transcriptional regulator n=1 Tax=Baekduia soli TaxID=496014 RepID=A0A5B8U2W4_9ACTN|nr:GntR family transcriptional regulator [Baekduia soli]QEC47165.1 GntR family transcriptional regulator [Baekduia soli]